MRAARKIQPASLKPASAARAPAPKPNETVARLLGRGAYEPPMVVSLPMAVKRKIIPAHMGNH